MSDMTQVQIYVALLDEGTAVWRPVEAVLVGPDEYRIVSRNADPEDEIWEFQEGDVVRCSVRKFSEGGQGLIAIEKCQRAV